MTDADPRDADLRAYDPDRDREGLWRLKRAFELELGAGGGTEKQTKYEGKLDPEYRERYLAWVERCVAEEDCVFVADATGEGTDDPERDRDPNHDLEGYLFLLPERLAFVWDAAVLNEVYVRPERRGTGLADGLMERAVDHARGQALPLDRLVLDVDRGNERARSFYDRHGFTHWGEMVARDL
ncbi:GNAT family N-acetyltransferase [Halobacteriales archaeon QS_5_70_15]|nr:MAG: GNAT family N-acetyltransferase [Halobacteriales archaeon QS_5_70_15]